MGLYSTALDSRVSGLVSISGFTPMRTYTAERGLIPRLGFFVPYDFDELIASIAPRPVMVVEPRFDRDGTPPDVRAAVDRARNAYQARGASASLALSEPWDYTRLPNSTQDEIIQVDETQSSMN